MKVELTAYRVLEAFEFEGKLYNVGDPFHHEEYEFDERLTQLHGGRPAFVKRWREKDASDEWMDMDHTVLLPVEVGDEA